MKVSGMLIVSMMAKATMNPTKRTEMFGANARNIWTARMSELAREMSWPVCTRS